MLVLLGYYPDTTVANVESSDEEQTLKIELPNSRNTQVMTEFIVEGHYMVVLHETKKAAAKAALVTTDVMNALIRRAQMAGVRVTERSATGFRFAVPTYMERLITTSIRDEAPRQLMLEAFFSPVMPECHRSWPRWPLWL